MTPQDQMKMVFDELVKAKTAYDTTGKGQSMSQRLLANPNDMAALRYQAALKLRSRYPNASGRIDPASMGYPEIVTGTAPYAYHARPTTVQPSVLTQDVAVPHLRAQALMALLQKGGQVQQPVTENPLGIWIRNYLASSGRK